MHIHLWPRNPLKGGEFLGWQWTVTSDEDGKEVTRTYRTNTNGDGIWQYARSTTTWNSDGSPYMEWQQITGTCQFSLPPGRKAAYMRLRRYFQEE